MKPGAALQLVDMPEGLRYASDQMPGFTRTKRGKSFVYRQANGQQLRNVKEIARIKKLAIPPAYTEVWICPHPQGHVQATGRDARGRKQYRYTPIGEWTKVKLSLTACSSLVQHCRAFGPKSNATSLLLQVRTSSAVPF